MIYILGAASLLTLSALYCALIMTRSTNYARMTPEQRHEADEADRQLTIY